MNTDQAFDLLKDAGVTEDSSIQTVRRWLRERKIKFNGKAGYENTSYILDDTDQAIQLLKDAGVPSSIGFKVVQTWLKQGKIHKVGNGKQINEYLSHVPGSKQFTSKPSEQDKIIRDLNSKLKIQEEYLKGIEELHQTTVRSFIQQRDQLHMEMVQLEKEKSKLQKETRRLLTDNLTLRKELLQLREELSKKGKGDIGKKEIVEPSKLINYRQKLGLSSKASQKDVLAGFKRLLKITHPDQGGHATAFHYIKKDYDQFKMSIIKDTKDSHL